MLDGLHFNPFCSAHFALSKLFTATNQEMIQSRKERRLRYGPARAWKPSPGTHRNPADQIFNVEASKMARKRSSFAMSRSHSPERTFSQMTSPRGFMDLPNAPDFREEYGCLGAEKEADEASRAKQE